MEQVKDLVAEAVEAMKEVQPPDDDPDKAAYVAAVHEYFSLIAGVDDSGTITKADVITFMKYRDPAVNAEVAAGEFMMDTDANKDGIVTKEEFLAMCEDSMEEGYAMATEQVKDMVAEAIEAMKDRGAAAK